MSVFRSPITVAEIGCLAETAKERFLFRAGFMTNHVPRYSVILGVKRNGVTSSVRTSTEGARLPAGQTLPLSHWCAACGVLRLAMQESYFVIGTLGGSPEAARELSFFLRSEPGPGRTGVLE